MLTIKEMKQAIKETIKKVYEDIEKEKEVRQGFSTYDKAIGEK